MYFIACILTFQNHERQRPLDLVDSQQIAQDLLILFEESGKEIDGSMKGEEAHSWDNPKIWIALVSSNEHTSVLRVTFVEGQDPHLFSHFLLTLQGRTHFSLCHRCYQHCYVDLAHPRWSRISTWTDLFSSRKVPSSRLHFTFVTPMLTSSPEQGYLGSALPFPEPLTLFTHLEETWSALLGPSLPADASDLVLQTRCVLADYHFWTVEVSYPPEVFFGYRGWVEYLCLKPEKEAMYGLNALAELAFFTGSGYLTQQGMGLTLVKRGRGG